jgi:hypothetical protein
MQNQANILAYERQRLFVVGGLAAFFWTGKWRRYDRRHFSLEQILATGARQILVSLRRNSRLNAIALCRIAIARWFVI